MIMSSIQDAKCNLDVFASSPSILLQNNLDSGVSSQDISYLQTHDMPLLISNVGPCGHSLAEPIHLASVLFEADDSIGARVVAKSSSSSTASTLSNSADLVDVRQIRQAIQRAILKRPTQSPPPHEATIGSGLQKVIQRAMASAKSNGDTLVALDHLLVAIYDVDKSAKDVLESAGLTKKMVVDATKEIRGGRKVTSTSAEETYEALEKYGIDLVKSAEEGKLDPVIGRDEEIRRIIQILCRRTKNNPCLVGEPGVGKTAVVEGLVAVTDGR